MQESVLLVRPALARGIRARWITQDLAAAYDAVIDSATRFQDDAVERSARMRLLRFGARVASEPSHQVNSGL